jgi:hypothetical protein
MDVKSTQGGVTLSCNRVLRILRLEPTLPAGEDRLPADVGAFVREAQRRIERFHADHHIPGFVPCDFARVYRVLQALAEGCYAPGRGFCEWGSGFGVVACLAAMLDFDACGIEIEQDLVDEARLLASDFDVPVEFICGSFIPEGGEAYLDVAEGFAWLTPHGSAQQGDLNCEPSDFDLIFAYPWPDEEEAIPALFERYAGVGAILLTYHGGDDMLVRRKERGFRPRRRHRGGHC